MQRGIKMLFRKVVSDATKSALVELSCVAKDCAKDVSQIIDNGVNIAINTATKIKERANKSLDEYKYNSYKKIPTKDDPNYVLHQGIFFQASPRHAQQYLEELEKSRSQSSEESQPKKNRQDGKPQADAANLKIMMGVGYYHR